MSRETSAAYLYCVVRSAARPSLARVPLGVPAASRPDAHRVLPSLWIVTARVPLEIYGPAALEPRLRDLDWVAQAAVAHEAVVEHFAKRHQRAVIPMKLFTLFSSAAKAVADVAARKAAIQATMRRIAGAEEWGIRIFRRPVAAAVAPAAPSSGVAFLRARKEVRDAAVNARRAAADAADAAFAGLRRHSRDARLREGRQEPGTNPPILEAAFLVAASARRRFKAEARRQAAAVAAAGADLALTGPWPAYNFVASGHRA